MAKATSEELVLITPQQQELITETIEAELAAVNVTDQAIKKYLEEALAIKINGPDDKAGYEAAYKKRIEGKNTRVLASKICKAGREPLQAKVALWIEKETEIVIAIKTGESHIKGQEDAYEAAKQKIEDDKQAAIAERLKERDNVLVAMGARCNGVDYYLDELNIPLSLVKAAEDDFFHEQIVKPFQKIFAAKEEIRIAHAKAEKEHREQQEKERQEFEKNQRELRLQEAKVKEAAEKLERQKESILRAKTKARSEELEALGFTYSMHREKYIFKDLSVDPEALTLHEDADWSKMIAEVKPKVEEKLAEIKKAKEEEQARLSLEAIDKAEREKTQIKEAEELDRKLKLELAGDKTKYAEVLSHLKETPKYEMRSGQYRHKMSIIRNFIDDLK